MNAGANRDLVTEPEAADVFEELMRLESLFHSDTQEATPELFDKMLASEFREVGASGKCYGREAALMILENRIRESIKDRWTMLDVAVTKVSTHVFLITYALQQPTRITRRCTLWKKSDSGWQAFYHQGTAT